VVGGRGDFLNITKGEFIVELLVNLGLGGVLFLLGYLSVGDAAICSLLLSTLLLSGEVSLS
jgi:hypothetical protein